MKLAEKCPCGSSVEAEGDNPLAPVQDWRANHLCDRRPPAQHEQGDAYVESSPRGPVGFTVDPT